MPDSPSPLPAALADCGDTLPLFPTWQARDGSDRKAANVAAGGIAVSGVGRPGPIASRGGRVRRGNIFADYPGAKGGAGVWQAIINQIPPHDVWIEAFAGSGAVTRRKRPATAATIVIDCDAAVVAAWRRVPGVIAVCSDAVQWLANTREGSPGFGVFGFGNPARVVVYCDPPYLRAVRSCARDYYRHEFASEEEHVRLLAVLRALPARVILSGYPSALYARELPGWRTVTFQTVNRRGRKVTECLWLNFPEPFALHQYNFLGRGFRERERIKRKKLRWQSRLARMPMLERAAILEAVASLTVANDEPRRARIAADGVAVPGNGPVEDSQAGGPAPSGMAMRDPIGARDDARSSRGAALTPEPSPETACAEAIAETEDAAARAANTASPVQHPQSSLLL